MYLKNRLQNFLKCPFVISDWLPRNYLATIDDGAKASKITSILTPLSFFFISACVILWNIFHYEIIADLKDNSEHTT